MMDVIKDVGPVEAEAIGAEPRASLEASCLDRLASIGHRTGRRGYWMDVPDSRHHRRAAMISIEIRTSSSRSIASSAMLTCVWLSRTMASAVEWPRTWPPETTTRNLRTLLSSVAR